ncbi:MAG TPA: phosphoenolpyruvate--protein phosphotransferase [Thermoanaerobaculia bacterium]
MLQGLSVSSGVAVGRAVVVRFDGTPTYRRALAGGELDEEERRLRKAALRAADTLRGHSTAAGGGIGDELAAILEAHALIACDETFLSAVAERIRDERVNAEWALADAADEFGRRLALADSSAMRERAADIADVAREIGRQLSGGASSMPRELPRGSILVADELSPADAARLDPRRVRAIALERGGATSHATIIARSFGMPAIVGVPGLCAAVSPDRAIVVDAERGTVDVAPSKERLRRGLVRAREARERQRRLRARTARAAVTKDGLRVVVRANLELPEEVAALERYHAEGVGLFRSEFLYLKAAPSSPGVEEQRAAYERLLDAAGGHPVVVRTYDLGGEKGIGPVRGDNPALGLRGLRYCLSHPELFDTQLAALCLAAPRGDLRVLLPMVTSVSEVRVAREHLGRAAKAAGLKRAPDLGVMIEVPSAALSSADLARTCDFFSIGTNDLAQYALAVDRANPDVAALYQPLHPAILRMIRMVVEAGRAAGRPVSVCGELAADPLGIAVLLGLGISEVSVTPVSIGPVKEQVVLLDSGRAAILAGKALEASDASDVERIFKAWRL